MVRILSGIVGAGGVTAAGGYLGTNLYINSFDTVSNLLLSEGYILLDQINQWDKEWDFYKTWLSEEKINDKDSYINKCSSLLSKNSYYSSDKDLFFLLQFCVARSIESHIFANSKQNILSKHSPFAEWSSIVDKNKSELSSITKLSNSKENKKDIVWDLKNWCYEASKKIYLHKDEQQDYQKVLKWCVKTST